MNCLATTLNLDTGSLVDSAATIALGMAGIGFMLGFLRLVRGPSLPDRVVALDLLGTLSVGIIAIYDITTDQPILLDAATVMALVAFLGTVAFAHYVERKGHDG